MPISTIGQNGLNAPLSLTSPTIATPTFTGQATIPTINLTGGQITFPATQSASSDANTLDDYEEGTFTPTLNFGGGTTGITYNYRFGKYTKVGNVVTIQIGINLSNKGSSTGTMGISGLPFTVADLGPYGDGSLAVSFGAGMTAATPFCAIANRGVTSVGFNFFTTSGSSPLSNSDITSNGAIIIGGSYLSV